MNFTSLLCPAPPYISETRRKISPSYNIAFLTPNNTAVAATLRKSSAGSVNQMRKLRSKTFENIRKRLKIFENIRKMMRNDWKYLKIFEFFAGACAFERAENARHSPQLIGELEIGDWGFFGPPPLKLRRIFNLTDWGILGGETHATWWVEYVLNAIVAAAMEYGSGEIKGGGASNRQRVAVSVERTADRSSKFKVPIHHTNGGQEFKVVEPRQVGGLF